METISPSHEASTSEAVIDLREEAEVESGSSYLDHRDRAADLIDDWHAHGYEEAYNKYVSREANQSLREQAEVMMAAREMHELDQQKPKMTDRREIQEAKNQLVRFNHSVRHLLTANPESVYLGDLQAWLTESTGDESWANGIVGGVAGEVALARAVEDLPDVKWVEFSSPEEDREGMDIIVGFQDGRGGEEMLGIDVKSRHHLAQGNQLFPKPATRHHGRLYHLLEVGVDRNHIKDNAILDERFHQPQLSGIAARIEKLKQRHQGHRQPAYA